MGRKTRKPKGERLRGKSWEVYVRVNGELRWKTFPFHSTPDQRASWRIAQKNTARPTTDAGSFAADVETYLSTVRHMPTYQERAYHLGLWLAALGRDRPRFTIATTEIDAVLSQWRAAGKSPTTVRHRRTALLHLFHRLDGKHAANPVAASWRPRDPAPQPRAIDAATLKSILRAVKGPKTRAWLRVMAATGLPHKSLMQLTPDSIDWTRQRVRIPAREKGRGAPARWLPMNRHARYAFRALDAAGAWGKFSSGAMRVTWQRALKRLGLPKHLRPYDIRHSIGSQLYAATGDLATVARLLGHADIRTASRYSLDAHANTDAEAMQKIGRRLANKAANSSDSPGQKQADYGSDTAGVGGRSKGKRR
jgi:integrase/recombinase XerD